MRGKTVTEVLHDRIKKQSSKSSLKATNNPSELNVRRQKTAFLRELISLRSEVGRIPNHQIQMGKYSLAKDTKQFSAKSGSKPLNLRLPYSNQHLKNYKQFALFNKNELHSEPSTPYANSALDAVPNDVIYSLNLEQSKNDKINERQSDQIMKYRAVSGQNSMHDSTMALEIDKGRNSMVPATLDEQKPEMLDRLDEHQVNQALLALPVPNENEEFEERQISSELKKQLGEKLALQVMNEKMRIEGEIKHLQNNIQKEVKKRKQKKDKKSNKNKSSAIEGDDMQASSPGDDDQDDLNTTNAFMTQAPQKDGPLNVKFNDELQVDIQNKNVKKSKTWRLQEQRILKCLNFRGIKDKFLLDHLYPEFQMALEHKTKQLHHQQKQENQIVQLTNYGDSIPFEWIEQYQSTQDGAKKRKPLNRTDALYSTGQQLALYQDRQLQEPKRLKVCKFNDQELQMMCYKQFEIEKAEWKNIQKQKDAKANPYIEPIKAAQVSTMVQERKRETDFNKAKRHILNVQILEALKAARQQSGVVDDVVMIEDLEDLFDPEQFVGDQFKGLSLEELQNYLYQTLQIQMSQTERAIQRQQLEVPQIQDQANQQASYKERVAFIQTLKKKWMVQKGYCSMFDRLREQRLAKQKVSNRKEELELRKKLRQKLVQQSLKRATSGNINQSHPNQINLLETVNRSKSYNSQEFETLDNQKSRSNLYQQTLYINKNSSQNIHVDQQSLSHSRKYKSKKTLKDLNNLDRVEIQGKKKFYHANITNIPRPMTHSPSRTQRGRRKQFNRDIRELSNPSNKNITQSPKSLKEWTEEKVTGHSLTLVNSLAQPLGALNAGRNSDQIDLSGIDQKNQLSHLYDVAKKDMETLERLIGSKKQPNESQDESKDNIYSLAQQKQNQISLNQLLVDGSKIPLNQVLDHQTMPYSDPPRSIDKPSEVRLRTTGMSSLILSPQAKVELIEASKGDLYKRARELETDINQAEKEIYEPKKFNPTSTINSPLDGTSIQERIVVRMSEQENQNDISEVQRQASIEAKLALFQNQSNNQFSKMNNQFIEPLAVREVSPELLKKQERIQIQQYAKNQNQIAPKGYRSAHARRQRDIRRLLDSKQKFTPKQSNFDRAGSHTMYKTQREETETQPGQKSSSIKDIMGQQDLKNRAKQSSLVGQYENDKQISSAAAFQDLRPALNRLAANPYTTQIIKSSDHGPSAQEQITQKNGISSPSRTNDQQDSKDMGSDKEQNVDYRSIKDSKGSLVLKGRQMLNFEQLKNQKKAQALPFNVQQYGKQRHRSRDHGDSTFGLNVDITDQFGKQFIQVKNDEQHQQRKMYEIRGSKIMTGSQPTIKTGLNDDFGLQRALMPYDQRPDGSSFETKRRSDLQTSHPEIRDALGGSTGPEKDLEKAASTKSKNTMQDKNALLMKSYVSTPGDPRGSINNSKQFANKIEQEKGHQEINAGVVPGDKKVKTSLEDSQPESTLTHYVNPNKLKKNQPIFSQYQHTQAVALSGSKQITSLESGFQDQDFLQNRLDIAHLQQLSHETPVNASGQASHALLNFQDKGSSLIQNLSNQTPLAKSTVTQKSAQPPSIAPQSMFMPPNQSAQKQLKKHLNNIEDATKANTNALQTGQNGQKRQENLRRKEALKPKIQQFDKNIQKSRPPLAKQLNNQFNQKSATHQITVGTRSSIAEQTEGQNSEYAIYVMPHMHLTAHARLRHYPVFQPGDQDFTKVIHNEPYFSRMAKINPEPFAISGQGIKGQYITPKQLAILQQQSKMKNQKKADFSHLIQQVDQNTGPDISNVEQTFVQQIDTMQEHHATQNSDGSKLMPNANIDPNNLVTEQFSRGFKFPSVHIQPNEQESAQMTETAEKEKLAQSLASQSRKRVDQRGPGSTVTADLQHIQNFSPTESGHVTRKVERERRSFDPKKGKAQVSPRFSMQDAELVRQPTFKAMTNGQAESFSEVSPGFRLHNNFDHEMILSGQQTTENYQQVITAQKARESEIVEYSQFDNEQFNMKDVNNLIKSQQVNKQYK